MKIAASERRAVIGSNGAGKTTLFNAITGDFMPTAGRIRFFNEDITTLPVQERIRRGLRRTYQISQLFGGLSVRDSVYLACRGVSRGRFALTRPRAGRSYDDAGGIDPSCGPSGNDARYAGRDAEPRPAAATRNRARARRRAALYSVRRAGRRACRRPSGATSSLSSTRLPKHIGYIIIEHDLDVALRVTEYVTMLHNGQLFKEGTPEQIENDPEVQEVYLGGRHG